MPLQNSKDVLSSLTKKELTKIRQYWQFEVISQLNKAELIEALTERIKAQLRDWLKHQLPKNIKFLEKVIEAQPEISEWRLGLEMFYRKLYIIFTTGVFLI
jgi:hypothetical protein